MLVVVDDSAGARFDCYGARVLRLRPRLDFHDLRDLVWDCSFPL